MRGNCISFALRLYIRRRQRWIAAGRPRGKEPRIERRPSRLYPQWIGHYLYAERCHYGMREVSFVPLDQSPLPWWRLHEAVRFRGRIKWGD